MNAHVNILALVVGDTCRNERGSDENGAMV